MIVGIEKRLETLRQISVKDKPTALDQRSLAIILYEVLRHLERNGTIEKGTLIDGD